MNRFRPVLAVTVLILVTGLTPAWSQEKVLVPGDPPLTQELVDNYRRMGEWALGIELREKERREWQTLFVAEFLKKDLAKRKALVASAQEFGRYLDKVSKMQDAERARERFIKGGQWLDRLRKSKDRDDRLLVEAYDAAYKPGGPKNPILVAGATPLTKTMVDVDIQVNELLLDFGLTEEQCQKYQQLMIDEWKGMKPDARKKRSDSLANWAKELAKYNDYHRNLQRAMTQPKLLDLFHTRTELERGKWMLALYESAYEPGSKRNPVLVQGDPQLTQVFVDRYRDYVEVMLDLSVSGGFNAEQRKVFQDYLVTEWKTISAEELAAMVGDVKAWLDAAAAGGTKQTDTLNALRPKLLARLQTNDKRESNKWLLAIAAQERNRAAALTKDQQMMFDAMRTIIGINQNGHWWTNPSTKHVEWVPGR